MTRAYVRSNARTPKAGRSGRRPGTRRQHLLLLPGPRRLHGEEVAADPHPITKWISTVDNTREIGQIEDRAAEYFEDQNLLLINADFRMLADMIERWDRAYGDVGGAHATVEESCTSGSSRRSWRQCS